MSDPLRISFESWLSALAELGIADLDDLYEVHISACAKGGTVTTVRIRRGQRGEPLEGRLSTITTMIGIDRRVRDGSRPDA